MPRARRRGFDQEPVHRILEQPDPNGKLIEVFDLRDIDIQIENNTLTLKGERTFQSDGSGYHRIERSYGSFVRYFTLPNTVDTEKVKAEYKNGVLTVSLPKKETAKPRQIRVEAHQ